MSAMLHQALMASYAQSGGGGGGGGGGDPFYSNVSLLLHLDGVNGSTSFIDASGRHTFAAAGNAQLSTGQSKFGGASLLLDGNGDYISCTDNLNDFRFGTGDFTAEAWIKTDEINQAILDFYSSFETGSWQLYISHSGILEWWMSAQKITGHSTMVSSGNWVHVAVSRAGENLALFVDGVLGGSVTDTTNYSASITVFGIGAQVAQRNASYDFSGYIDEVRITKGTARYTANFTPPNAPFPDQ